MTAPKNDRDGIIQCLAALALSGWTAYEVQDGGDENVKVNSADEAVEAVMAVDMAFVLVRRAHPTFDTGYVYFVLGNAPDEVINDYTINLESVIDPLTDEWFED